MQNAFGESFNGRMRDELLNETLVLGLRHARAKLATWATDYNTERPHSGLGYLTPAAKAASSPQRAIGCATPTSSADHPLLHPCQTAYQPGRL